MQFHSNTPSVPGCMPMGCAQCNFQCEQKTPDNGLGLINVNMRSNALWLIAGALVGYYLYTRNK